VLPGIEELARGTLPSPAAHRTREVAYETFVAQRDADRARYLAGDVPAPLEVAKTEVHESTDFVVTVTAAPRRPGNGRTRPAGAVSARKMGTAPGNGADSGTRPRRRSDNPLPTPAAAVRGRRRVRAVERRRTERRGRQMPVPFPDRRLTRSAYEKVFLKLVSGGRLKIGAETYTPVGMIGWDQAVFRRDSDGKRRLLSIDQLLKRMNDWK
jgi:hypothetical protein